MFVTQYSVRLSTMLLPGQASGRLSIEEGARDLLVAVGVMVEHTGPTDSQGLYPSGPYPIVCECSRASR